MPMLANMPSVQQQEAHCGPATLEMMFSFHGIEVPQTAISKAAGVIESILDAGGMRLDELNEGVQALFPGGEYALLARYHSSLDDMEYLVEELRLPVGIEWQGRFMKSDGRAFDQGHYSVVTGVDRKRGLLTVEDPEKANLLTQDGKLAIDVFEGRWWEIDIVPRPDDDAVCRVIEMEQLLFVVAPQARVQVLLERGFRPATRALMWEHSTLLEPMD